MGAKEDQESNWGGRREGAGRPPTHRKPVCFRLNEDEERLVRGFIKELRKGPDSTS